MLGSTTSAIDRPLVLSLESHHDGRSSSTRLGPSRVVAAIAAGIVELRRAGVSVHRLRLADGEELTANTVILATGVLYKRLDIPGMERLEAPSVYHAATESEAQLCPG
jgi:thioredoxin reductase